MREILEYASFTHDPTAGNPAGVVLDASGWTAEEMLQAAARINHSETAFITQANGSRLKIRYFSPKVEVDFCGHATIAAAVAWAERHGPGHLYLDTAAGDIEVAVVEDQPGVLRATLTSVPTSISEVPEDVLSQVLDCLQWQRHDLDPQLPPRVAFGGVHHLVLAAATRERLADLSYDFETLERLMLQQDWITLQLVWREHGTLFHSRNPFPVGGVVEDPATGAAAAAFGGYLRALGALKANATFDIIQGEDMGRRSEIGVELTDDGRSRVSGTACVIS